METQHQPHETGSKYYVNIEGTEYLWDQDVITVAQIRQLGSIPDDQQISQENPDGSEETLVETIVIELKPGHRFGRAPKYKRG